MSSAKRRKKRKNEDMEKALEVVQKSQATVSGAAKNNSMFLVRLSMIG